MRQEIKGGFIMKKVKNMLTILTAAALLLMSGSSLKVSAAEPVTYYVIYEADAQDWRYQTSAPDFEDTSNYRELYYMNQTIKDGDTVVVYYDGSAPETPSLDLGNLHLSNLTIAESGALSIVHAGAIDDCFVLTGTSCVINGNITNAYVYNSVVCNFNNNVKELQVSYGTNEDLHSTIGCSGTIGHFKAYNPDDVLYDLYEFQASSFHLEDGELQTPGEQYRHTPSQTAPTAPAQPTPAPSTGNSSPASSGEYDSVPKTGENSPVLWLVGFAVICLTISFGIKRKLQTSR